MIGLLYIIYDVWITHGVLLSVSLAEVTTLTWNETHLQYIYVMFAPCVPDLIN